MSNQPPTQTVQYGLLVFDFNGNADNCLDRFHFLNGPFLNFRLFDGKTSPSDSEQNERANQKEDLSDKLIELRHLHVRRLTRQFSKFTHHESFVCAASDWSRP